MKRIGALVLIGMLAGTSALAAQVAVEVPAEADRVLWCGSAFYWLAADASDAGENAEADQYGLWSDTLMAQGIDLLAAPGFDQEAIDAAIESFDTTVVEEMGTPTARYDVTACPELVDAG